MTKTATAYQKFIHQSPRKLRLVADAIRGEKVAPALTKLSFTPKKAALEIKKVLSQAAANAVSGKQLSKEDLKIKAIVVEEGPRIKRWQPVSRGMAHAIVKRTSHLKITVEGNNRPLKEEKKDK
jgi:large subunit ribosomal protein L22